MFQDLCFNHLPILLAIPLSLLFRPNQWPPAYNFQKACLNYISFYCDSHCPSTKEYSSISSATALFTSLALNAAKFSIPFGRAKRQPQAWWSPEVEEAISGRRKGYDAAHRRDEDRQAYVSGSFNVSSIIAKFKAKEWQTTCLFPSPKYDFKSFYFFFVLSLALLPHLPPLLTS